MNTSASDQFLEMPQAINLLIEFGEAYSLAREDNKDTDGTLCRTTQMLLALLTNQAARPEHVEEVFPHTELLSDS